MVKIKTNMLLPIKKHCIEKESVITPPPPATVPTRSLDFESGSSQQLSMAGSSFGALNSTKWTYHIRYKRESTGVVMTLARKDPAGSGEPLLIRFLGGNTIDIIIRDGAGPLIARKVTTATFTDTASWHQIVVYWDSNNATAADRLQLYHDQTKITAFSTANNPSLGATATDAADGNVYMGSSGGSSYFDGLLYQQAYFNDALPAIGTLHSGGSPVDLTGITGLMSLLNTNGTDVLEDDYVLSTNWTNTNTVIKSTDIPT